MAILTVRKQMRGAPKSREPLCYAVGVARPEGFEPPTLSSEDV